MQRLMCGAMLAAIVFAPAAWAQETPGAVKSGRADEIRKIQQEYSKAQSEYQQALLAAKTPEERRAAAAKRPNLKPLLDRAQKLVDADAKDAAAGDALIFISQSNFAARDNALELLAQHHAANPNVATILSLAANAPAGEKLLKAVLEKNSDVRAKGLACYHLGNALHRRADRNPAQSESLNKEAEEYFVRIEKEFPKVEYGKTRDGRIITLGQQAKRFLFEIRNLAIGKSAPEATSQDLSGTKVKLSDYRGKVVVLDIWATWCGPCRAMIPHEREMVDRLKDKPFALISISADEKKETLTQFLEKESMPWTHWWEGLPTKGMLHDWNVQFYPTIYVLDAKGVIRHKNIRGKELEEAVVKLLEETK